MHHHRLKPLLAALLLGSPAAALAADAGATFEGGVTAVLQDASDSRVHHDGTFSVDLVATVPAGPGVWTIYLEGSSAPADDGVAALLGEANGDAGSALDSHGNGRLQLSELHYALPLGGGTFTAGLMDTSAFLDTNGVANDETSQFLNANLVNNPTIGFPDYTLGIAWQGTLGDGPGLTLVAARSHGLGDDYASYSSLFDNSIDDVDGDGLPDNKGLFLGGELAWAVGETTLQAGLWANTADHAHLDGSPGTDNNAWGLYGLAEGPVGGHLKWNLRAGWAAPKLSEANAFLSGALEIPTQLATVGLGAGRTWVSNDLAGGKDTSVAELYGRFALTDQFALTPSVQWVGNSNFDGSGTVHDDDEWVISLRAQLGF